MALTLHRGSVPQPQDDLEWGDLSKTVRIKGKPWSHSSSGYPQSYRDTDLSIEAAAEIVRLQNAIDRCTDATALMSVFHCAHLCTSPVSSDSYSGLLKPTPHGTSSTLLLAGMRDTSKLFLLRNMVGSRWICMLPFANRDQLDRLRTITMLQPIILYSSPPGSVCFSDLLFRIAEIARP